jgi:hydrogenase maturation protease
MSAVTTTVAEGRPTAYETLVLGIGNPLWADEGFGVRAAEALNAGYEFPPQLRIMDGGTMGLFLLPYVRSARNLLIFDAIDFGLDPAELRVIRDADVPQYLGAKKMSMHQTGFQEVLASARLSGDCLDRLALVGVQPELLDDYGGSLRDSVKARIPDAVDRALAVLDEWGVGWRRRERPLSGTELTGPDAMDMGRYESGRPDTDETWR